jgi:hypothetical protein
MFGRVIDRVALEPFLDRVVPGQPVKITVPTQVLSPVLGWNTVSIAVFYSPTKAAVASKTFMPNPLGLFGLLFILVLIGTFFSFKKKLMHENTKTHKTVLAPHIALIVGGILLGTIAFSALITYILSQMIKAA